MAVLYYSFRSKIIIVNYRKQFSCYAINKVKQITDGKKKHVCSFSCVSSVQLLL